MPDGANPAQEKQMLLAAADRPSDSNPTFTTGGDVSRFQRRTVPARAEAASAAPSAGARPAAGGQGPVVPVGPVVRIARGNDVTVVPVGAR